MKPLVFLFAFIGLALAEDFQCYSCKNSEGGWIDCGESEGTLEKCSAVIQTCAALRIVNKDDKTMVMKGCIPGEEPTTGALFSEVKKFAGEAFSALEIDGCFDIHDGDAIKDGSALCMCSTSECNGATGLQIMGALLVFSICFQQFFA
ncbi:uncharacterized protein LOC131892056 [Tigriopus californicus]|uniref:uncharacterized protein LOC131892056 n=1 Tax=Tigriopus californicus TaxID=6832 RepID=UPI0027DA1108|nr:uncharacterized protein LOC131892056 [Tigriopus californicus]